MSSHHYIYSIHFFSNSLVHLNTRVTDGNDLVDVLLLEFFHSTSHGLHFWEELDIGSRPGLRIPIEEKECTSLGWAGSLRARSL